MNEFGHILYFFDRNFFLKNGKYWNWNKVHFIKLKENFETLDIDTEEDFFKASALWQKLKTKRYNTMRNYLVTGGAGFIGSHVVDLLLKLNKRVKVIDNLSTGQLSNLNRSKKNIQFFKVDISKKSKKLFKIFKGIDCVIHCAGLADLVPSITSPNKYFSSNVIGTLNVLNASRENKVKKICLCSFC